MSHRTNKNGFSDQFTATAVEQTVLGQTLSDSSFLRQGIQRADPPEQSQFMVVMFEEGIGEITDFFALELCCFHFHILPDDLLIDGCLVNPGSPSR